MNVQELFKRKRRHRDLLARIRLLEDALFPPTFDEWKQSLHSQVRYMPPEEQLPEAYLRYCSERFGERLWADRAALAEEMKAKMAPKTFSFPR